MALRPFRQTRNGGSTKSLTPDSIARPHRPAHKQFFVGKPAE
jgi:hypothetical protein